MLLPGRLSATTLGDVLGALSRSEVTGILELTEVGAHPGTVAGRRHAIHLAGGLVLRVDTVLAPKPLGELLAERDEIDQRGLAWLDAMSRGNERALSGALLVRHGFASEDAVKDALVEQLRLRLDALFALADARIAFRVARGSLDRQSRPLHSRDYLRGRPRARDRFAPQRDSSPERRRALELLGLSERATVEDVRKAFRLAARDLHPDRGGRADSSRSVERTRRLAELSAAYHVLVD